MELLDNYYNELRELIYEITLDKNGWFNFSKRLLDVLDVSYVHIQAIDFSCNVLSYSPERSYKAKYTFLIMKLNIKS